MGRRRGTGRGMGRRRTVRRFQERRRNVRWGRRKGAGRGGPFLLLLLWLGISIHFLP